MSEQQSAEVEERAMVSVDVEALGELLHALTGPGYLIRELQVTRNLDLKGLAIKRNPINLLIEQYNAYVEKTNAATEGNTDGN
ncbi:hypothetical protein [Burkholderia phage FLC8]|nr:hypothetical protein [Burkholderia phage FLC8]